MVWHVRLEEAYLSNIQTARQAVTDITKLNQSTLCDITLILKTQNT